MKTYKVKCTDLKKKYTYFTNEDAEELLQS